MYLGFFLGVMLLIVTQLAAPSALNMLGVSGEVSDAALQYIGIRQLYCPLTFVSSIAQSAYLASKNVYTPLKLVLLSGAINAVGDLFLVGGMGMGIAGAAWATLASQLVLSVSLIAGLRRRGMLPSWRPLPTIDDLKPFGSFARGITVINFLRVCGFFTCTYYASCYLSTQHLAAQQILVSVFVFLSMIAQPLLQCCQALLPRLLPGGAEEDIDRARSTVRAILSAALYMGVASGLISCLLTFFCHGALTSDSEIVHHIQNTTFAVFACYLVNPLTLSLDSVLVAAQELDLLCWTQAGGLVALIGCMALVGQQGLGLSAIWIAYCAHLVVRLCVLALRVCRLPGLGVSAYKERLATV